MISRDKAQKYLDVVLSVLAVINDLTRDKLFPAEVALAGIRTAIDSLDDDIIENITPEEIRALATELRNKIVDRNAEKDQKLKDKFDTSDDTVEG